MKNEFDHLIKTRIESLEKIPHMEFNDKKVWDNVRQGTVSSSGSGLLLFVGLSVIIIALGVLYNHYKIETPLRKENKMITVPKQTDSVSANKIIPESIEILEREKNTSKVTGSNDTTSVNKNSLKKPKRVVADSSKASVDNTKQQDSRAIFWNPTTPQVQGNNPIRTQSLPKKEKEIVLSLASNSLALGLNYVNPLTKRSSVVFGAHLRKYDFLKNNFDTNGYPGIFNLEIPLQFRYHLNLPKSRFNAFLYTSAVNSFDLGNTDGLSPYGLRFESGAELRYLIFKAKNNRSKGHLFLRLPFYNRSLINNNMGSVPYSLLRQR